MTERNNYGGSAGSSFVTGPARSPQYPQYTNYNQAIKQPRFTSYTPWTSYDAQINQIRQRKYQAALNTQYPQGKNPLKDPYAINSLADVIFNTAAKKKKYGSDKSWIENTTRAMFDHTNDSFIKPMLKGDFVSPIVNSLVSLSKDLDILSNPIKGMIQESKVGKEGWIVGGVAAAAGGIAAALSGPVGWAAILGASLASAGVAAAGTALVKDPDAAVLGFKRGLGTTDEGRYTYNLETGSFIGDLVTEIVLDPFSWAAFGGKAIANTLTPGMKTLVSSSKIAGSELTMKQMWNVADTIMDKLFIATRAMGKMDSTFTKMAYNATPIGLTWKATKGVRQTTSSLINRIKVGIRGVADLETKTFNPIDISEKTKALTQLKNKDRISQNLARDLQKVGLSNEIPNIPRNLDFVETYTKKLFKEASEQGMHTDATLAYVTNELNKAIKFGVEGVEYMNSPSAKSLSEIAKKMSKDDFSKFLNDFVAIEDAALSMANESLNVAEIFGTLYFKDLPDNITNLEVLSRIEEMFAKVTGAPGGSELKNIFASLKGTDVDITESYAPLFDSIASILDSYGISMDDFKSFLRKGSDDIAIINRLASEVSDFGGLGSYQGGKVKLDKILSPTESSRMEVFKHTLDMQWITPESVLKVLGESEGSVITVAKAQQDELINKFYSYKPSMIKSNMANVKELQKIVEQMKDYNIPLDVANQITDMSKLFAKFDSMTFSKNKMQASFRILNNKVGGDVKLNPLDLKGSIDKLKTVLFKSGVDLDAASLAQLNDLIKRASFESDIPKMFLDITNSLDHAEGSIQKLFSPMVGVFPDKEIIPVMQSYSNAIQKIRDNLGQFTPAELLNSVANQGSRQYYMLQASKTRQFMSMAMDAVDASPKFFDEVLDSNSVTSQIYKNIMQLDARTAGFNPLKQSFKEVYTRVKGNHNYLDLTSTLNRGISTGKYPEEVLMPIMDIITRNSSVNPKVFLDGFNENVMDSLMYNLRASRINLSDANTDSLVALVQQYANKMQQIGADSLVYIPGSGFEKHIKTLMEHEVSGFLDGLVSESQRIARLSEMESLKEGVMTSITRIKDANEHLNSLLYVSKQSDSVMTKNIDSIIGRSDIAKDIIFSDSNSILDTISDGLSSEPIVRIKYPSIEERMRKNLSDKLQKVLNTDSSIDREGLFAIVSPNEVGDVATVLRDHFQRGFEMAEDNISKIAVKDRISAIARLQKSNADMLTRVTETTDQLLKMGAAEGPLAAKGSLTASFRSQTHAIMSMPAPDLASFLKYNTNSGFVVFTNDMLPYSFQGSLLEELSEYGITIETGRKYTVIKNMAETPSYKNLMPSTNKYSSTLGEFIGDGVDVTQELVPLEVMYEDMFRQVGKTSPLTASTHTPLRLDQDRVLEFLQNDSELMRMIGGEEKATEFLNSIPRSRGLETSFIGPYEFMRGLGGVDQVTGNSMMTNSILTSNFQSALSLVDQNHDTIRWFNVLSDPSSRVSSMMGDIDPKEAVKLFRNNPEMKVAYFGADMKVRNLNIRNLKDFQLAIDSNAIITDSSNYSMMYRHLNKYQLKNLPGGKALDLWRNNVQTAYSAAYLSTPGAVFRNYFDATSKNIIIAGDARVVQTQLKAYGMMREVGEIVNALEGDLSDSLVDKMIASKFADASEASLMRIKYDMVRDFVESAASGGEVQAVIDKQMRNVAQNAGGKAHKPSIIQRVSYDNPVSKFFLNGFSGVEDMARFGLFMELKMQDLAPSDILHKIMETHFDYTTRTPFELYLQQLVPFITFPLRNFMWWAEHAYDNPMMLRQMTNMVTDTYVNDEYRAKNIMDPEKGTYNRSQLMSGNPQQRKGDYNTLFKLNPSVFDAFGFISEMITDPTQRVAAPIKNIYKSMTGQVKKWDDLEYPAQANLQRFARMVEETGPRVLGGIGANGKDEDWRFAPSLVNSIFSVTKYEPKEYAKANKALKSYSSNAYGGKSFAKKTYAKRTYFKYPKGNNEKYKWATYGAPNAYRAKGGGHSLSTGHITKYNNFRSSAGIGYGNAQHNRSRDMGIAFGKKGAYLRNAPDGVYLKNAQWKNRTVYQKMYSASGNARLLNRARTIKDARGLMFRLQDMKYNMF